MTYSDLAIDVRGPEAAPPVLLLHGWGSQMQHMLPLADGIADAYQTHTIDLPGHGQSPPPPEPWGVPEHAALLHNYIASAIERPVSLVGHSNGGRIGLFMASTPAFAPSVERLALISPSGIEPQRSWQYHLRSGTAKALKAPFRLLPTPLRDSALDWLRHSAFWRLLGSSDYNTLNGVMRETFVKTVTHHLNDQIHRVAVPTLLFWGTCDAAISRRQMAVLENAIDDCGLVELDGAGHYGQLDALPTVRAGLRHFLEHTAASAVDG